MKKAFLSTIRALMNHSFFHFNPIITVQIGRIQKSCTELMKNIFALTDCTVDEEISGSNVAKFKSHVFLAVCGKLKQ